MVSSRRRICLYFGSFNPLHRAHLRLAQFALDSLPCDEVWLVLSPLNPLKERATQLPFAWRAYYIRQAIEKEPRLRMVILEEQLPLPHYTVRSIRALRLLYPEYDFSLLIGSDNLRLIDRWYDYQLLLKTIPLHVYPRPGYPMEDILPTALPGATIYLHPEAPQMDLAATDLREAALRGEDLSGETAVPELWEELRTQLLSLQSK